MRLYTKSAHLSLLQHVKDIKGSQDSATLHCIFCSLDKSYYENPEEKGAFLALLQTSDLTYRDLSLYWIPSGHMFIFSKDSTAPIIRTLRDILGMTTDENENDFVSPMTIDLKTEWTLFEELIKNPENSKTIKDLRDRARTKQQVPPSVESDAAAKNKPLKQAGNVDLRGARRLRHKPYLLVVEDDRTSRYLTTSMMEPYCHIIEAHTIEAAQSLYEENLPNIVFMDIELPDGDGEELTRALCKKDPEAFIVMVSGNITQERIDRCMDVGARGFIAKPISKQLERMLYFIHLYNSTHRPGNIQKKA